jgi:hypothetical protein
LRLSDTLPTETADTIYILKTEVKRKGGRKYRSQKPGESADRRPTFEIIFSDRKPQARYRLKALTRKAAICPLVTSIVGQ